MLVLNMLPSVFVNHVKHSHNVNSVLSGQAGNRLAFCVRFSDIANYAFCQFCQVLSFASRKAGYLFRPVIHLKSALSACVLHVCNLSPNKQMVWPDASAVIALVKYAQPFRDWSDIEKPRGSMSQHSSFGTLAGYGKSPVAVRHHRPGPIPTLVCLVGFFQKSRPSASGFAVAITLARTELLAFVDWAKWRSALLAGCAGHKVNPIIAHCRCVA